MTEAIKIVVQGNDEQGGYLSVQDALNQLLDSLALVSDSIDEDVRRDLDWNLVEMTMNSPLVASVEPICRNQCRLDFTSAVRKATEKTDGILRELIETKRIPSRVTDSGQEVVKRLLERNANGVFRTDFYWPGHEDPVSVDAPVAKEVLEGMRAIESVGGIAFQGTELGSIEGNVVGAITHYGNPAVRIRHRVSEKEVTCVIPPNLRKKLGEEHSWNEVWAGRRFIVTGEVKRKASGDVSQLLVADMHEVDVEEVDLDRIADPDFTGGKSPVEYLDELWGD